MTIKIENNSGSWGGWRLALLLSSSSSSIGCVHQVAGKCIYSALTRVSGSESSVLYSIQPQLWLTKEFERAPEVQLILVTD